nr:hypothetical protein [Actinomycetota bacterium]
MIEGYLGRESILIGERLDIHVSTDSASFRVNFYRIGAVPEFAGSSDWFSGRQAAAPAHPDGVADHASPAVDWGWPAYHFTPSPRWNPGVYVAFFVESPDTPHDIDPLEGFGRAFFVLRSRAPGRAPILYKISSFTRHAYNRSDGPHIERASSLYDHPVHLPDQCGHPTGHVVSMRRPGRLLDLAYWDAPFIGWLKRAGYRVDFCTDLDLHLDPQLLAPYRLLLSVGHDEYWTAVMRERVERFVRAGG